MPALPFTAEQFFAVFVSYNQAVWPFQFVLALCAAAAVVVAVRWPHLASRTVPAFLAVLWVWSGITYHLLEFTRINQAAYLFGGLFVIQGLLFVFTAARGELRFGSTRDALWMIGVAGIAYSLVFYPVVGLFLGHRYPAAPTFGAPCPSTIFTFGILLWTRATVPLRLLVIPALWAVFTAPIAMGWGVLEDGAMPVIAILAVVLLLFRNRKGMSAPLITTSRGRSPTTVGHPL
jgi:hypothetical protein